MTAEIDFEAIAAISPQIHKFYCDLANKDGWKNDFPMPYSELPEFMKADNRAAARRIGQVLSLAGLRLAPTDGKPWTKAEQAEIMNLIKQNDYLNLLAEGEHDGWTQARLRNGWRVGPCKDIALRQSHLLVPYSEFPKQIEEKQKHERKQGNPPEKSVEQEVESVKNKDRDSVLNYVRIIAQTDYRIELEEQ